MLRRRYLLAIGGAVLLALTLTGFASAQEPIEAYRTQRGDTLSSIARKFCTTWQDIYFNNQGILGSNRDVIGAGVLIYVANRCTPGGNVYDRGPSIYARGTVSGNIYTVVAGDTWYSIGVRFGLPWGTIANANGGGELFGGRRLGIPGLGQGVQLPERPPAIQPSITIRSPQAGAVLPGSFTVSGVAQGLIEGNVIVRALDRNGRVLAQSFATAQGPAVSTGGPGTWSVQQSVNVAPGTPGSIVATGGGVPAQSTIPVTFGSPVGAPNPTQPNSNIMRFTVDRQQINPGECVTFYWNTRDTQDVYFYREGEMWRDNRVDPNPSHTSVCPKSTSPHFLWVSGDGGMTEVRSITIWVGEPQRGGPGPAIPSLVASPSFVTSGNRCTTLLWATQGADINRAILFRNGHAVMDGGVRTSFQDCVPDSELGRDIIYELRLETSTFGYTIRQVKVTSAAG
jgi:plastocyanin